MTRSLREDPELRGAVAEFIGELFAQAAADDARQPHVVVWKDNETGHTYCRGPFPSLAAAQERLERVIKPEHRAAELDPDNTFTYTLALHQAEHEDAPPEPQEGP